MSLVPLYGHDSIRQRLSHALEVGTLPQSLLLHGPRGVGKQRLALWLAQSLTCEGQPKPCGACRQCKFALQLVHPDIAWVFPRPRPESDASPEAIRDDLAEAAKERFDAHGLYPAPSGKEGIFVASIRMVVRQASITPAMARRKVLIIGDADRMVSQEGSDQAANAFLKLLEEPPADTYLILTSSQPASLLPTIRSRVVAVRVPLVTDDRMAPWLDDQRVREALKKLKLPADDKLQMQLAGGVPGRLLSATRSAVADAGARRMLEAADSGDAGAQASTALSQGGAGARGAFSDMLEALSIELRERMHTAARSGNTDRARSAAKAIDHVEYAKRAATGNQNPQLITWELLERIGAEP